MAKMHVHRETWLGLVTTIWEMNIICNIMLLCWLSDNSRNTFVKSNHSTNVQDMISSFLAEISKARSEKIEDDVASYFFPQESEVFCCC